MAINSISQKPSFQVRLEFIVGLILTLAIFGIYYQTRNFEFVLLDDDVYVTANPHVTGGLSFASIKWAFTKSHGGFWIPLTWISYMIDCQLHGLNAGDYHMTNLIFHVLNTLLLFGVMRRMTGDIWRCGLVAALFAVHPVHVESVAWVAERKDLLFAFFWLLTMWSYQYYVKQPCIMRYLPILLLFSAGLMSKPMIVTLPFVLMLIDFWPLRRLQLKKSGPSDAGSPGLPLIYLVLEKAPLLILSLCASVLTFILQQSHGALSSLKTSPITDRVANGLVSYVKYLAKMIWPHDLAVMYPYPHSIPLWQIAGSFLLLGLITFLVIKQLI